MNISSMAQPIPEKSVTELKPFEFPSDLCKPRVAISMGLEVISL